MRPGDLVRVKLPGIIWGFSNNDPVVICETRVGEIFLVIGGPPLQFDEETKISCYRKVFTPHGAAGWIHEDYVTVVPPTLIQALSEIPPPPLID